MPFLAAILALTCAFLPSLAFAEPAVAPHAFVHEVGDAGILPRLQAVLGLILMIAGCWIFRDKRPGQ